METPNAADVVVNIASEPSIHYIKFKAPVYVGRLLMLNGAVSIELTEEQWPSEEHQKNMELAFGFKFVRHDSES